MTFLLNKYKTSLKQKTEKGQKNNIISINKQKIKNLIKNLNWSDFVAPMFSSSFSFCSIFKCFKLSISWNKKKFLTKKSSKIHWKIWQVFFLSLGDFFSFIGRFIICFHFKIKTNIKIGLLLEYKPPIPNMTLIFNLGQKWEGVGKRRTIKKMLFWPKIYNFLDFPYIFYEIKANNFIFGN